MKLAEAKGDKNRTITPDKALRQTVMSSTRVTLG